MRVPEGPHRLRGMRCAGLPTLNGASFSAQIKQIKQIKQSKW
ncbi:hypothetical protein ACFY1U_39145 [Streptomyces sp. NPDC001351]